MRNNGGSLCNIRLGVYGNWKGLQLKATVLEKKEAEVAAVLTYHDDTLHAQTKNETFCGSPACAVTYVVDR